MEKLARGEDGAVRVQNMGIKKVGAKKVGASCRSYQVLANAHQKLV